MKSFLFKQDTQAGQNIWRNLNGPLKSEIVTNMKDYSDTTSDMELAADISPLSILEDRSPPSSPVTGAGTAGSGGGG